MLTITSDVSRGFIVFVRCGSQSRTNGLCDIYVFFLLHMKVFFRMYVLLYFHAVLSVQRLTMLVYISNYDFANY